MGENELSAEDEADSEEDSSFSSVPRGCPQR